MAESPDKTRRDRNEDLTGMNDENITGRANDEDVEEFDDREDLDDEEEDEGAVSDR